MGNKAVADTGPIIHLSEIDLVNVFNIFSQILIPKEVSHELIKNKIKIPKFFIIKEIKPEHKDKIKIFTNQHDLDIGESEAIVLALQEKADYFLTDDSDARLVAKKYSLEVHGTIGIILRAFREKIINKNKAIEKVNQLHTNSSIFITSDLIAEVIRALENFRKTRK